MGRRILSLGPVAIAAAALTLASSTTASAGSTQHRAAIPMRGHQQAAALATHLTWNGGPVEHNTRVFLDFWGSQWSSDRNGVQSYLTNFFNATGSDTMSNVLTQYTDSSGKVSLSHPVLAGAWNDNASAAPRNASANSISTEANKAASHFGVSGASVDIIVVSPSGTHPDGFPNTGFCAWHDWNGRVAFTNMPYVLDAGSSCGANSVSGQLDGFSIVAGHEYAEAATDPQAGNGWLDNSSGEENADLCAWIDLYVDSNGFPVQGTWSNAAGGCR